MSLTEIHTGRRKLKNSHEYPPTRHEVGIGRRFCCAVKFVERNRKAVLTRVALSCSLDDAPVTVAEVVQMVGRDLIWSGVWSFDEVLAWYWYKYVPDKHRRFVVDGGFFCEGIG